MDEIALFLMQQMEEEEYEEEEDLYGGAAVAAAFITSSVEEARRIRAERRQPNRLYLRRPQLIANPRVRTPWQALYESRNDRAYITTMGFDVATFDYILDAGFEYAWLATPIPRSDVSSEGNPRPGTRSLDAPSALGLLLHYLNSTMREVSLQQAFAIISSTCSRYITFGLQILNTILRHIEEAKIKFPRREEDFQELNDLIIARHPRLTGAFASIDGLKLAVQTSDDEEIENATFNGWLQEHFISSVLVFSLKGSIFVVFFTLLCSI
ncbi:putative DDE superfamily endonuclease [Lyophyllum shimeji]|uniref:DDE superfamily endonuclease n=1 Tax=Lyophyllum shimeji TaxID=47721 RepID=A0A9P3PZ79_LYOSH|nr:putative DDE superfamily endonuclease [Lyophyllum shimeji]